MLSPVLAVLLAVSLAGCATDPGTGGPLDESVVESVVDGDTLRLRDGRTVRLVGIDTPERGECGYDAATDRLADLVHDRPVSLGGSDQDTDRYGRLLRYVDVDATDGTDATDDTDATDAGLVLLREGLAEARYDSRDGYGEHPREAQYVRADERAADVCGDGSERPLLPSSTGGTGCAPGYHPCVPPFPPDVDCAQVDGPVTLTGSDPHRLDGDGDGRACE